MEGGIEERKKEREEERKGKEEIRETGVYHLGISLALVRPPRHPYINIITIHICDTVSGKGVS